MTPFITETAFPVDPVFQRHAPPEPVVYLQHQRQFLLTVISFPNPEVIGEPSKTLN